MILKRFKGVKIKRGGLSVRGEDYEGNFALHLQTMDGEEHEFVLTPEQVERLNNLTEEPVGEVNLQDNSLSTRMKRILGNND